MLGTGVEPPFRLPCPQLLLKVGICFCLPPPTRGPGIFLLEEPGTAISVSHVVCHSKLPMAGHSAQNDAAQASPSQRGLLVISRVALCV